MQQIVHYKSDPGNSYTNSLLCFMQLFIVTNRSNTYYFANNNPSHFSFNADEQFLPVYQFAIEDNKKITHIDDFSEKFLSKCTRSQMISKYNGLDSPGEMSDAVGVSKPCRTLQSLAVDWSSDVNG